MPSALWSIGSRDGRSADLLDTYTEPNRLGDVVWTVDGSEGSRGQLWPLFHPSEADPDAGYRLHPYTIQFTLDHVSRDGYLLRIDYLAIAPRLADLDIEINGVSGRCFLRPHPSISGEIRLHSGLHTSIYSEGVAEIALPPSLLLEGHNCMVLTARDRGDVIPARGPEHILRLDRMANASGLIYQCIELSEQAETPPRLLRATDLVPSIVYYRSEGGGLLERCHLYLDLTRGIGGGSLTLVARSSDVTSRHDVELPAIPFGGYRATIGLPDGADQISYDLSGELEGETISMTGEAKRARKWKVFVAPHAHTDIGYTHRQWEVAERLCVNIDRALDMVRDAEGIERSFAYHLDSSWALEAYLSTRDATRREELFEAIRSSRIGVAAGYVDLLTHYAALEDLIRNTEMTDVMLRPHGAATDFTTVVDVASLSSSLPVLLEGAGVRFLVHANNQDRGPFRLYGGLNRVSPYYWEGLHGGRVLVWLSKMYCELRKVCGSPPVPDSAERGLQLWLAEYERPEYIPDAVLLYGQEADNTDLDPQPADFIRRWNQMYAYPQLIPSSVSDFFHYVETGFGESFPSVRGDGGAYWEDGVGSHIASTSAVRTAQAALPAAETLHSLAALEPGRRNPTEELDEAWRQILLFDEHTWGSAFSVSDPDSLIARDQWSIKESLARDAAMSAQRLLHTGAVFHSLRWNTEGREIVVYNPHSWSVSGPATVEIHRQEEALDSGSGEHVPLRRLGSTATQSEVELWVHDLPGLSYRRYPLRPGATRAPIEDDETVLQNDRYRLVIDPERGYVTSWVDRSLNRELVAAGDAWGFGQLLYARGGEGTRLVSNQDDLPPGNPEVLDEFRPTAYARRRDAHAWVGSIAGEVPKGTLEVLWTLYDTGPYVDVEFIYRKQEVRAKEAVYVAFPLDTPDAEVLSDAQLGWVNWARDSLPGACKEWLPLQTGVLVDGDDVDVLICSPDVPLFCVGDVVRGRWPRTMDLAGGRILSYVLNNYWHTNYKAFQSGEIRFRYRLTSAERIGADAAHRLGWETRRPLYGHRISFQDFRGEEPPYDDACGGTLAHIGSDTVVVRTMKKARWGDGLLVRLQEIAGCHQTAKIAFPGCSIARAWTCNLLERDAAELPVQHDGSLQVDMAPNELRTIWILTTRS